MPEPYDLVVLLADADAERFIKAVIDRGIERKCLPTIHWRTVVDPMRDPSVVRRADSLLRAFARPPHPPLSAGWRVSHHHESD